MPVSEYRDYSALFTREGRCVLCNELRTIVGQDVHSEYHLARGEALNEVRYLKAGRVEQVIPMPHTVQKIVLPGARRLDPILQRIVRRELKRRKIAP